MLYGDKKTTIKAPADLKGVRVAVARASTQDTAVTAMAPEGTEIRRFDDDASAMQALLSGQVDAIGCSTTVAAQIAKRAGDAYENKLVLKQQFMAVAMRQGQPDLVKTVNDFVAKQHRQRRAEQAVPQVAASPTCRRCRPTDPTRTATAGDHHEHRAHHPHREGRQMVRPVSGADRHRPERARRASAS